ncbi:SMP-30/gluconolactonase/LRE family protein [Pseudorhodoplanes sp.]|uniref:SMP-30/gluconolactonase/LRE family protein n=1 Tax=Pseudorhodoplanes sp. TaxID=1934341 RepID=UPI003D11C543
MRIAPDGTQSVLGRTSELNGRPWIPNGLALSARAGLLIANMGEDGGIWSLAPEGTVEPFLVSVNNTALPATNFVLSDSRGRLWISVSTRQWPISKAFYPENASDGFIIRVTEDGRADIVADHLIFANELRLDAEERWLYVAETFAGRISRFEVQPDATLGERQTFAELPEHSYPDGLCFDAVGHLWVASIVSNRILRVAPDATSEIVVEEFDRDYVENFRIKWERRALERADVVNPASRILKNPTSLAFGTDDQTVYVGSLGGDSLVTFPSSVAGLPMQAVEALRLYLPA